jgi:hypothetical protein
MCQPIALWQHSRGPCPQRHTLLRRLIPFLWPIALLLRVEANVARLETACLAFRTSRVEVFCFEPVVNLLVVFCFAGLIQADFRYASSRDMDVAGS